MSECHAANHSEALQKQMEDFNNGDQFRQRKLELDHTMQLSSTQPSSYILSITLHLRYKEIA